MVRADADIFMPSTIEEALEFINRVSVDEVSVVDSDGTVYGVLADNSTFKPSPSGSVEVWTGAAHSGISMDTLEDALSFFQVFLTGLLFFPSNLSAEKLLKVLEKIGGGSFAERAQLLSAVHAGFDVTKVFD
jgi:hypothetical protein